MGVSGRFFRLIFFFPDGAFTLPAPSEPLKDASPSDSMDDNDVEATVDFEGLKDIRFLHATIRDWFGPEAAEQGALILSEPIEGSEEARPLDGQPQAQQAASALSLAVRHLLHKSLVSTAAPHPAASSVAGDEPAPPSESDMDTSEPLRAAEDATGGEPSTSRTEGQELSEK